MSACLCYICDSPRAETVSASLHSQRSAKCLAPEVINVRIELKLTHLPGMFTSHADAHSHMSKTYAHSHMSKTNTTPQVPTCVHVSIPRSFCSLFLECPSSFSICCKLLHSFQGRVNKPPSTLSSQEDFGLSPLHPHSAFIPLTVPYRMVVRHFFC